mgnify:CR=1 FL=1
MIDNIQRRRRQIDREIGKIQKELLNIRRDTTRPQEKLEARRQRLSGRMEDLYAELAVLGYPDGYEELPLAAAADELRITTSELIGLVDDDLVRVSSEGVGPAGRRVSRDQLAEVEQTGIAELVRLLDRDLDSIFQDSLSFLGRS